MIGGFAPSWAKIGDFIPSWGGRGLTDGQRYLILYTFYSGAERESCILQNLRFDSSFGYFPLLCTFLGNFRGMLHVCYNWAWTIDFGSGRRYNAVSLRRETAAR